MKKLRNRLLFVLMVAFVLVLAACSGDQSTSDSDGEGDGGDAESKTEISFWHAMSGSKADELEWIVDKINDQSDSVHVGASYQGSYGDSLTKLGAMGGAGGAPAIVQVCEIGTRYKHERRI